MSDARQTITRDILAAGAQATPGVAATAWTMNTVVAVLTAVLISLQIIYLIWKWRRQVVKEAADKAVIDHMLKSGRVADRHPTDNPK